MILLLEIIAIIYFHSNDMEHVYNVSDIRQGTHNIYKAIMYVRQKPSKTNKRLSNLLNP